MNTIRADIFRSRHLFFASLLCLTWAMAAVTEPHVRGIVESAEGLPLTGIVLGLYDYDAPVFSAEYLLAECVTDDSGVFMLEAAGTGDALLLLSGDQGVGRLKITVADENEPLQLRYPVRTLILLLHDNDLHFNFNCLDAFRSRIEEYRDCCSNVFLLNAGDIFIRHPDRWPYPGEEGYYASASYMIATMNAVGYDAMTVGNHELDYISDLTRRALEEAKFPLLGANIEVSTNNLPPLKPFTTLTTEERYSLAVLGLSNFKKEGINSLDPLEVAEQYCHLAATHDIFIALTHIGNSTDRRLAAEFDILDIIIGGHTHGLLETAEMIGNVLFARAGGTSSGHLVSAEQPKYLGVVKIMLENGRIVDKRGHVETFGASPAAMERREKIAPVP